MAKVTYKTYSRVAYQLGKGGKIDKSTRHLVYGGEVFVDGKLVRIISSGAFDKKGVQLRAKKLKRMFESKLKK